MKVLNILTFGLLFAVTRAFAVATPLDSENIYAHFGGTCHVRMKFPGGGRLLAKNGHGGMVINIPRKYDRYSQDRAFILTCGTDITRAAMKNNPARFDIKTEAWIRFSEEYIHSLGNGITDDEFQEFDKAIRFYPLASVNAKGFLFTRDELIGEEAKRGRYIRFCLVKNEVVLCGSGNAPVMLLSDGDSADPTIFLKKVIESIEFLDVDK